MKKLIFIAIAMSAIQGRSELVAKEKDGSATKVVVGKEALIVANEMQRGLVKDGILTPDGRPASRVFGTFRGLEASCDYAWGSRVPALCMIDPSIDLSIKVVIGDDAISVADEMRKGAVASANILTSDGRSGSRLFGTYRDQQASCDYLLGSRAPVQCTIVGDL